MVGYCNSEVASWDEMEIPGSLWQEEIKLNKFGGWIKDQNELLQQLVLIPVAPNHGLLLFLSCANISAAEKSNFSSMCMALF